METEPLLNQLTYENRIVAFIDILGFKEIIGKTVAQDGTIAQDQIDRIIESYDLIEKVSKVIKSNYPEGPFGKQEPKSKKITTFSDCIVISFLMEDPMDIFNAILEIQWIQTILVSQKIICRGSIVHGLLVHNDKYVFGPALVEAYEMETKAALYPRIIVERETVQTIRDFESTSSRSFSIIDSLSDTLKIDLDGMYFIDYFNTFTFGEYYFSKEAQIHVVKLALIVYTGLEQKPTIRIKYRWMEKKFQDLFKVYYDKLKNQQNTETSNFSKEFAKMFGITSSTDT